MGASPPLESAVAPPKSNRKKFLWIAIVAAVLVAIAITVGVAVAASTSKDTSSAEAGASTITTGKDTPTTSTEGEDLTDLQPPPQLSSELVFAETKMAVDLICGSDDAETREECEAECEDVPDCCSLENRQCLVDNLEGCVKYAKCQILEETLDVEAAPSNLLELCAAKDDEDSEAECQEACAPVSCCYNDEEECDPSLYFLTCLDYAPCQLLREGSSTIEAAPEGLDEICNPLSEGEEDDDREACEAACEAAECCWTEEENCLQDNFVQCLTYAPCGLLEIPAANEIVEEAPADLFNETCALDNIWEDGPTRDDCVDVCEQASCCVAFNSTTETDNCFLDDPIGCLEYAPCALLPLTGGSIPRPDVDLAEVCSWEALTEDEASEQACIDACQPAQCCGSFDGDENCLLESGNLLTCGEYLPCAILYAIGGSEVEDPPANLGEVCGREAFREDPQACKDLCLEGSAGCCFETDNMEDNCLLGHLDKCGAWTAGGCFRMALNQD